eukprot:m.343036 g.343036  ORF g.343036 m.343036 type:complete len:243 (-) comp27865_c7_seq1:138-866(-)
MPTFCGVVVAVLAGALLAPSAQASDDIFCGACKWIVNEVYKDLSDCNCGKIAIKLACLGDTHCEHLVTSACNDICTHDFPPKDPVAVCYTISVCTHSSSTRTRRAAGTGATCTGFLCDANQTEMAEGARVLMRNLNARTIEASTHNPVLTLDNGQTGSCIRDTATGQFLCSVPSAASRSTPSTNLAAGSGTAATKPSSSASAAVIGGVAALVIVVTGLVVVGRRSAGRAATPYVGVPLSPDA